MNITSNAAVPDDADSKKENDAKVTHREGSEAVAVSSKATNAASEKQGAATSASGKQGDDTPTNGQQGDTGPITGKKGNKVAASGKEGDDTPTGGQEGDAAAIIGKEGDKLAASGKEGDDTPTGGQEGDAASIIGKKGDKLLTLDPSTTADSGTKALGTMEVIGFKDEPFKRAGIVSKSPKDIWFSHLEEQGCVGLLYKDIKVLQVPEQEEAGLGISVRHWKQGVEGAVSAAVRPFPAHYASSTPQIYSLPRQFGPRTIISRIIASATKVLQGAEGRKLYARAPQLIVGSSSGCASHYVVDEVERTYRCFMFMGTEYSQLVPNEQFEWDEDNVSCRSYISTLEEETFKRFGDKRVVTMTGFFQEAQKKFLLHVGDIVILKGNYPFSVDLPVLDRLLQTRMLTWVFQSEKGVPDPGEVPCPRKASVIEDIVRDNEEAMKFYAVGMEEMTKTRKLPRDVGIERSYMERIRVTPGYYDVPAI